MKIKATWGFVGNAKLLNAKSSTVRAGQEFDADDEYAHILIGKGLVEPVGKAKASEDKAAKPAPAKKQAAPADKQAKADEGK